MVGLLASRRGEHQQVSYSGCLTDFTCQHVKLFLHRWDVKPQFLGNGKNNPNGKVNKQKYCSVSFLGGIEFPVQMTPDRGTEPHFLVEMDDPLESRFHIYRTSLHVLCGDEKIAHQLLNEDQFNICWI